MQIEIKPHHVRRLERLAKAGQLSTIEDALDYLIGAYTDTFTESFTQLDREIRYRIDNHEPYIVVNHPPLLNPFYHGKKLTEGDI